MIKIGGLFSLTGTTAVTEKGLYNAVLHALDEHNRNAAKKEGLVEFEVRDIASDPSLTMQHTKELIDDGTKYFIGTYTSACRKAILPLLKENDCLLVYPALYEGHEAHPNVFYTGEVPNQQVYTLLKYMKLHFGSNIFLIGTDYIYPRDTNNDVKKYWGMLGGNVIEEEYVPFGHSQFTHFFKRVMKMKANAIFSTLVGDSLIPFYRTYKQMGFHPDFLPIFSPITKETEIKAIGKQYTEGHFSAGNYFQSIESKENEAFVKAFKNQFGETQVISSVMFNTYIGMKKLLEKISSKSFSTTYSLMQSLSNTRSSSPSGTIIIEKDNHHLSRPIRIGKVNRQGQFSIVWDSKKLIPAIPYHFQKQDITSLDITPMNWSEVFEELMAISEEPVILLDECNEILYSNEHARQDLQLFEGQLYSEQAFLKDEYIKEEHFPDSFSKSLRFLIFKTQKMKENSRVKNTYNFHIIKTYNEDYERQLKFAEIASNSDANVLILGETGSGKEVMARAIHLNSPRKNEPFIAINAGALPRELIASELFGFVEGAFTGAKRGGKIGKFELANGGTLFLDEIGEMPIDLQVNLLRVLETRTVTRIGENREREANVRIISATNRNLKEEIAYQGSFRSDLYYRLNVMNVKIPPLRERPGDIPILTTDFLTGLSDQYDYGPISLSPKAMKTMKIHSWPGNIRELRNMIERAFLIVRSENKYTIEYEHLPDELKLKQHKSYSPSPVYSLLEAERITIQNAMRVCDNISDAAKLLQVSRSTLYRKLKVHAIESN